MRTVTAATPCMLLACAGAMIGICIADPPTVVWPFVAMTVGLTGCVVYVVRGGGAG